MDVIRSVKPFVIAISGIFGVCSNYRRINESVQEMKLYVAQVKTPTGLKDICITEQFYEHLKTKNKKYENGNISIDYTRFEEK